MNQVAMAPLGASAQRSRLAGEENGAQGPDSSCSHGVMIYISSIFAPNRPVILEKKRERSDPSPCGLPHRAFWAAICTRCVDVDRNHAYRSHGMAIFGTSSP